MSMLKKNKHPHFIKTACTICLLALLSGCGTPKTPSEGTPTGGADQKTTYLTSETVKSIALENAGLSADEIRLTRLHLDSSGTPRYEIEFISSSMEYDYVIDAVTGEILSMVCEAGSYDLNQVPEGLTSQGGSLPEGSQDNSSPADSPQSGMPPEGSSQDVPAQSSAPQNNPSQGQDLSDSQDSGQYIGREAARQAALSHAGLNAEDVYFTHSHLEFDDGRWQYDVEFHRGSEEYDYDIDALTGEILSFDHDAEYIGSSPSGAQSGEQLTPEAAKQLALAHAGVSESDAQRLEIDFDYDDGRAEYEIEWHVGRTEYSCDVDAYTGEILSFEKELD